MKNEDIKKANEMTQMKHKMKTNGDEMTNVLSSLRSKYEKEKLKRARSARKRKARSLGIVRMILL